MATLISTFAMVLAGHAAGDAQAVVQRDHRGSARLDARRDDRQAQTCVEELREYARKNDELEQRLYRLHSEWHREHDRDTSDNSVRQHNELHARLDRTREDWDRAPKPERCEDARSVGSKAGRAEPDKKNVKRKSGN